VYTAADRTNFYRVPFQDAVELVRSRRAFLEDGYVYVAESDMNTIIIQLFKARLNHALAVHSFVSFPVFR
jgi:DNA primase large subunit